MMSIFDPSDYSYTVSDYQENMTLTGHTITGTLKKQILPIYAPDVEDPEIGLRVVLFTPSETLIESLMEQDATHYVCGMKVTESSGNVVLCSNNFNYFKPIMTVYPDDFGAPAIVGEWFASYEFAEIMAMPGSEASGFEDYMDYFYVPESSEDVSKVELIYVPLTIDEFGAYASSMDEITTMAGMVESFTTIMESKEGSIVSYDITALKDQIFFLDSATNNQSGRSANTLNASMGKSVITPSDIPESIRNMFKKQTLPNLRDKNTI